MKRFNFYLKSTLAACLVMVGFSAFGADTLSVDTQLVFTPGSFIELIEKAREITGSEEGVSFDAFYVYVTGAATFILGFLRNLLPKWSWIQSISLDKIPREVTVALLGLTVVLFIVQSGIANVDWTVLIGSVFGTMGVYSMVKSLVEKIPNPTIKYLLLMVLGKFKKEEPKTA